MLRNNSQHWSQHITNTSSTSDLEPGVFSWNDPPQNRVVDAEFLYQSGGEAFVRAAAGRAGESQGRIARVVWQIAHRILTVCVRL